MRERAEVATRSVFNALSLAGLAATFVGNGIGRFAYIALMPALIQSGWFSKREASYLGVATLVGYLFGAPLANFLVKRYSVGNLLRAAMLACSFSYLACAIENAGLSWYYVWRTLAGVGGAMLMVLAAPLVVQRQSMAVRGKVSGVVFSGIGLGAMVSGTLMPLLILQGISSAWLGMGSICLLLTLMAWQAWEVDAPPKAANGVIVDHSHPLMPEKYMAVGLILLAYTLNAIGYLPHTLFWVDYIVRELKMSLAAGGFFWAVFGIGAAVGPLITGHMGDAFGFKRSLVISFLLKGIGVAMPLLSSHPIALFASSFLVGFFTPGIVTLVSTYVLDCVGAAHHRKAWSMMTFFFAVSQAGVGYVMAFVASGWESYRPLFLVSALALVISAVCIVFTHVKREPRNL